MMKKLFLLFVKYVPVIQMAGMIVNNTLCLFDVHDGIIYLLDFIIGNSYISLLFMLICSYMFGFCTYYRLILLANFINLSIAMIDSIYRIPISDRALLMTYYIVYAIFIGIITINHVKHNERYKVKNSKESS